VGVGEIYSGPLRHLVGIVEAYSACHMLCLAGEGGPGGGLSHWSLHAGLRSSGSYRFIGRDRLSVPVTLQAAPTQIRGKKV
jgi:hypothetical protein